MKGTLVLVGTPIGNLEDISPRAVRALREAAVIYCEDTRRTRKLLSALAIPAPPLVRLDVTNEAAMVAHVQATLEQHPQAALVTDAGMPTISDPGQRLVKGLSLAGYPLDVVPGPCAITTALALSGLPSDHYRFVGFLARKGKDRTAALERLAGAAESTVIYEAPLRVHATLEDLSSACGPDRPAAAAKELTKLHQEVFRGTVASIAADLPAELKGEWVLVIGPAPDDDGPPPAAEEVEAALASHLAAGEDRKSAVAAVAAAMGLPKRVVYDAALQLKQRR